MTLEEIARSISDLLNRLAIQPLAHFFLRLTQGDRIVFYVLLATAIALGFAIGRRRTLRVSGRPSFSGWRFPTFQNSGEELVSRVLLLHFGPPDYHLMNHVTLRMEDGTTQVDHILVSRFGVFVIETKITIAQLAEYLRHQTEIVMSPNRVQFCVGRLETARLAISRETDVEHIQNLARKRRDGAV